MSIYLDNNATTPLCPDVIRRIMEETHLGAANPSSAHSLGRNARRRLESDRDAVAGLMGCLPEQVIFTGSGTEANNAVLNAAWREGSDACRIVTTEVEHSSVLACCDHFEDRGATVIRLGVDASGLIDVADLDASLKARPDLVSIQWVNNETGVVQPVELIGERCREAGVPFHVDAAQAFGKVPMQVARLPIDFMTVTAHKLHGPTGVGALYMKEPHGVGPIIRGGSQEHGVRAGTENLIGIAGFGEACRVRQERLDDTIRHLDALRQQFESLLVRAWPEMHVNGRGAPRVAGSTNVRFHGLDGQALVARLDQAGVICSQSSACTNHRPEPSYVLRAMGLSEEEAYASVRFSFSTLNTEEEVEDAVRIVVGEADALRSATERLFGLSEVGV